MTEEDSSLLFEDEEPNEFFVSENIQTSCVDSRVQGEVLRVVFVSEGGEYSVIRLLDSNGREQTLVGALSHIMEGQTIEATGRWELHKEHGRQFRVTSFRAVLPSSKEGMVRFLASGVLPGIGETYARRIVEQFGEQTFHILDTASERLKEVPGIGKKRIQEVREAWRNTSAERETRVYLQGLGISPTVCSKLILKYGVGAAAEVVRRNPYRLASEMEGIGFRTADAIASTLGIAVDNDLRLCAGMVFALEQFASQGHTCCSEEFLLIEASKLLGDIPREALLKGLQIALSENKICRELTRDDGEEIALFFLRRYRQYEMDLAHSIRVLLNNPLPPQAVPQEIFNDGLSLNQAQRQAVENAFLTGFSIVTGGPGVGKTTVVRKMVQAALLLKKTVLLAAPTGRASKRLSEATGREALTVHRLLKWDVQTRSFLHNEDNPLTCDLLVIDEVSMLDTQLAANLFCAIEPGTRVVMVGDKDQLPSVGPGAVLCDLIACGKIPVTYLTEVYRQAENSRIITNAHAVNRGMMPDLSPVPKGALADFYWIEQDDPLKITETILRLVTDRIPNVFHYDPFTDVQVLTPMRKGDCGTLAINERLQAALNPSSDEKPSFQFGNRQFRVGDKVMQISNNYDKGVFNGEMGLVTLVDNENHTFGVLFDAGQITYDQSEADQLQLAYAATVHKSQGSEFPVVIMPVTTQHYVMLQRNLVYTGMTRAKKLLILIGSRRALGMAISNNSPNKRRTRLAQRIRGEV